VAVPTGRITRLARPSVRPPVCSVRARTQKQNGVKNKIDLNVAQGRSYPLCQFFF